MRCLIIHFSDLHIKASDDIIFNRSDEIFKVIRNHSLDCNCIALVLSGDIAYSGKEEEFSAAHQFIKALSENIAAYSDNALLVLTVPGNHDGNFDESTLARNTLIDSISTNEDIDDSIIDQVSMVQDKYFEFTQRIFNNNGLHQIHSSKLLNIFQIRSNDHSISFLCFNSAWMSRLSEQPGTLFYPIDQFPSGLVLDSSLVVSVIHHPCNWYKPNNLRVLRNFLEEISDIILIGHEHTHSAIEKRYIRGDRTTLFIEGDALQDLYDSSLSGFNLLKMNLNDRNYSLLNFHLIGSSYETEDDFDKIFSLPSISVTKEDVYQLQGDFLRFLYDPGVSFKHPVVGDLYIEDIYILPNLRDVYIDEESDEESLDDTRNAELLEEIGSEDNKYLLIGSQQSGKSALCKHLYIKYFKDRLVPIYLDGSEIRSADGDSFQKLIRSCFKKQYESVSDNDFFKVSVDDIVLIIDDFDKSRLNTKFKHKLIDIINSKYKNVLLVVGDVFRIEELVYEDKSDGISLINYKKYEILEFGHSLRSKLIERWNILGREEYISDLELIKNNDKAKKLIDTIIGYNFVPSYPFYLLTILQTIEFDASSNLEQSTYGYYYDFLITNAFNRLKFSHDEIEMYYNYVADLAYFFFKNKLRSITDEEFKAFNDRYCKEYILTIGYTEICMNLQSSLIIELYSDSYRFKYKYIYYYFVAKYLSNNITEDESRKTIDYMSTRLYNEEYSNILMFLTHLSKDPYILEKVISSAKNIFKDVEPANIEADVDIINKLITEIPKIVIIEKDVRETRKKLDEDKDLAEKMETKNKEYEEEMEFVTELNVCFKTIELLGLILKNYYGSLKGSIKYQLMEEACFAGLRANRLFFLALSEHEDVLIDEIERIIENKGIKNKDDKKKIASRVLFQIANMITYYFIKKISGYIGAEKLIDVAKIMYENNPTTAISLINTSIRLENYIKFPYNQIRDLKKEIENNLLAYSVLRRIVINYLYMFPTNIDEKQQICTTLGIGIAAQRAIDRTSVIKKKVKKSKKRKKKSKKK